MPTVETKIWLALRSRIATLPLTFPVAWPAQPFMAPDSGEQLGPYLRIGRVTVDPAPVFIADNKRHLRTGTLIVTLVHPLGHDVSVFDEYAGMIAAHFFEGGSMQYDGVCIRVVSQPHVQPGYEENGYWTVPVSIPWRTFA